MKQAHKLHLQNQRRNRGFSQGNIHQLSSLHSVNSRSFAEDRLRHTTAAAYGSGRACDDLVLSVLKTPVRDAAAAAMLQLTTLNSTATTAAAAVAPQTTTAFVPRPPPPALPPQQLTILPTPSSAHSSGQSPTKYQALQAGCSEDELIDDIESAKETTKLSGFLHSGDEDELGLAGGGREGRRKSSSSGFKFLRRFRTGLSPKIDENHRSRNDTPLRRRRSRGRSHADILDGVPPPPPSHGKLISRGSPHSKHSPNHRLFCDRVEVWGWRGL